MIQEFNMDKNPECGQLSLAHVTRNKKIKQETKTDARHLATSGTAF